MSDQLTANSLTKTSTRRTSERGSVYLMTTKSHTHRYTIFVLITVLLMMALSQSTDDIAVGQSQGDISEMDNYILTTTNTANSSINLSSAQIQSVVIGTYPDLPPCQEVAINSVRIPLSFPYYCPKSAGVSVDIMLNSGGPSIARSTMPLNITPGSWSTAVFNPPVIVDFNSTVYVKLQMIPNGRWVRGGRSGAPGTGASATQTAAANQQAQNCPPGPGTTITWSINTSDPYPDGALLTSSNATDGLMKVYYSAVSDINVLALYYDPIIESRGSKRLHEATDHKWNDPSVFTRDMKRDIERESGHAVQINIIERWMDWPPHEDSSMDYTDSTYPCYSGDSGNGCFPDRGQFGYQRMFDASVSINGASMSIQDAVDNHIVDEIWVWSDPTSGVDESAMAGDGAYYINGAVLDIYDLDRRVAIMGWNMEAPYENAQESLGHRIEYTLARVYGGASEDTCAGNRLKDTYARRFSRLDDCLTSTQKAAGEVGGVGVSHVAVNGEVVDQADIWSTYDTGNTRSVPSEADEWFRFPNLRDNPPVKQVSCRNWSCNESYHHEEFQNWLWRRLPKYRGKVPTATPGGQPTPTPTGTPPPGTFNNFWAHLFNPSCFP